MTMQTRSRIRSNVYRTWYIVTTDHVIPDAYGMGDHQPVVRSITEVEHLNRRLSQVRNALMNV